MTHPAMFSPSGVIAKLLFALTLLLGPHLRAETNWHYEPENRNIEFRVTVHEMWSGRGFYPVHLNVTNNEAEDTVWDLTYNGRHLHSINAKAGQTTSLLLYLPPTNRRMGWYTYSRLDVKQQRGSLEHTFTIAPCNDKLSGTSPSVSNDIQNDLSSGLRSNTTITPARWPADYRIYSSLSYIIFDKADFDNLDPGRKSAIREWVMSGGHLAIVSIDPQISAAKVSKPERLGFGTIQHYTDRDAAGLVKHLNKQTMNRTPFSGNYPSLPYSIDLPPPPFILILLLIAFAVIIGPVCLFIWAPVGKRQRLFILVPSIAVAFSALLFLLILLIDGTGGSGIRSTSVYLSPEANMAIVKQSQECRTGLLLGNTFHLDHRAEFYSSNDSSEASQPQYRSGDLMHGNWFVSRSSLSQQLSSHEPTRARITLVESNQGNPVIQSTVPGALSNFIYRDSEGRYWKALEQVTPGRKITLNPIDAGTIKEEIPPNSFHAHGEPGAIAPIATLDSIKWQDVQITYHGPVVQP